MLRGDRPFLAFCVVGAGYETKSLHLSVRESGRSREAIRPVLKTFPFSGSLELHATQESPLTQPAMVPALD